LTFTGKYGIIRYKQNQGGHKMYIKQSLVMAEAEAKVLSTNHPDIIYYVVDAKRKPAKCYSIVHAMQEAIIFGGYHPVCRYKAGQRMV